jgi:methylated-DNA-protein-cysteine methyltransferase-like protein
MARQRARPAATLSTEATPPERIWQVVTLIPPGRVATYGQVAELAGLPRRARLVGRVLSQLPDGTGIPWHRVVNAAGRISLPAGSTGFREQRARLRAEGITIANGRLALARCRWLP